MMFVRNYRVLVAVLAMLVALLETGCGTANMPADKGAETDIAPDLDLNKEYAHLSDAGGQVFTLDSTASNVRILVFRAGRAARLGHNHVLTVPKFSGFAYLPADGGSARFDIVLRLDELLIDEPAERARLGGAFGSVPTAEAIAGTREHMLGDANFQATRYPYVRLHCMRMVGEAPKMVAQIDVEMHGQHRVIWSPLDVEITQKALRAGGSFVLRQSDFGVQPYSIMGGMLAVQDEIIIDFMLSGH